MKSKLIRNLKKHLLNKTISILPNVLRDNFIREQVQLNYSPPKNLVFKLAKTKEELEQAYQLLYHAYVASGSMPSNKTGLRVTPYHALPSSSVLIACLDKKVVATVSVFRGGTFGIPVSKIYDISRFEKAGLRYAEISSLCVSDEYKQDNRELLFGLLKYMYEYSINYFGIDAILAVIKPFRKYFYESALLFDPLENRLVHNYKFSNGATVMAEYLNLKTAPGIYKNIYNKYPDEKNLYKYFIETKIDNFEYPDRQFNKISDPVMTPELLNYFFLERTPLLQSLDSYELSLLKQIYTTPEYNEIFKAAGLKNYSPSLDFDKRENRIETKCNAFIFSSENIIYSLQVHDVSMSGLMVYTHHNFDNKKSYTIKVEIEENKYSELEIISCWNNGQGHSGFKIIKQDALWSKFISHLSFDLLKDSKAA